MRDVEPKVTWPTLLVEGLPSWFRLCLSRFGTREQVVYGAAEPDLLDAPSGRIAALLDISHVPYEKIHEK